MSDAQWAFLGAVIVGLLALVGNWLTSRNQAKQMDVKLEVSLAEMRKDITSLRDETKKHNSLIERTYKVEADVARLQDEEDRQNHRLAELEKRPVVLSDDGK